MCGAGGNPYFAPIGGKAQIQVEKGLFVRCSRDSVLDLLAPMASALLLKDFMLLNLDMVPVLK